MVKVALISLLLILTGCTTSTGNFCDIASPIRLSGQVVDTMSDSEVTATLKHNERGAALCGWRT